MGCVGEGWVSAGDIVDRDHCYVGGRSSAREQGKELEFGCYVWFGEGTCERSLDQDGREVQKLSLENDRG